MTSITILVPVYNERAFIDGLLASIAGFLCPSFAISEVIFVDGLSDDGTRERILWAAKGDDRIQLLDNPARFQSSGLNLALKVARGDFIVRLDAHSIYPGDYLARSVETCLRTGCDNAGGIVETLTRVESYQAALVQALITHKFGVGNSGFRTSAAEGPADTVPYGCFRRTVFERVGLFDERLKRAQDYEMNRRILAAGGIIWRNPQIRVSYFALPDFHSFIVKQMTAEAPYNAYMWYLAPYSFALRHGVTAVFAAGVISGLVFSFVSTAVRGIFVATMVLYAVLAFLSSVQQAVRFSKARHMLFLPIAFFLYHFLHGTGVIAGLVRLATGTAPVQKRKEPWDGAGRFRAWPLPIGSRTTA